MPSPLAWATLIAQETAVFSALKTTAALGHQAGGYYLVPTNQMLRPWGEQTVIAGRPVDMAFDSAKRILAVLDTRSLLLLDGSTGTRIAEIPARTTSYAGIAFRPGNRELWASETARNGGDGILVAELSDTGMPGKTSHIDLKGHPVPTGIAFSPDGKTAYVAMSRNNTLGVIDATTREVIREIEVGIAPFGVAVSKSGKIYVTNRGGRRPGPKDTTAPSSGTAVVTDPVTGSSSTGTVSVVDAETLEVSEVPVGLAPSQLTLSPDEKLLAVANGHSDSVSILDTKTLARTDIKIPTIPEAALGTPAHRLGLRSRRQNSVRGLRRQQRHRRAARIRQELEDGGRGAHRLVPHRHRPGRRRLAARAEYQGRRQHAPQGRHLQLPGVRRVARAHPRPHAAPGDRRHARSARRQQPGLGTCRRRDRPRRPRHPARLPDRQGEPHLRPGVRRYRKRPTAIPSW